MSDRIDDEMKKSFPLTLGGNEWAFVTAACHAIGHYSRDVRLREIADDLEGQIEIQIRTRGDLRLEAIEGGA